MTTVYFVRHCKADNSVQDDRLRPLKEKGLQDRELVTRYLSDKEITAVLSSPYKRAVDTLVPFAKAADLEITLVESLRERKSDSVWLPDEEFLQFVGRQWADFSYALPDGESLGEVQQRNIEALEMALTEHSGESLVIGTHGTALSTIINYYDNNYGINDFLAMVSIMPWIVVMEFDGLQCKQIEKMDLLTKKHAPQ